MIVLLSEKLYRVPTYKTSLTFDFFVKDNLPQKQTFSLIPHKNYMQRLPSFKDL